MSDDNTGLGMISHRALVAVFMPTVSQALDWREGGRGECMLQMGRSAIQTRLSNGTADRGI